MNSKQMHDMLLGYPVAICTADNLKVQRGIFVISNTDNSQGHGKHWVTFYFPKRGPFEFFVSLGHMPEEYAVAFEKILNKKYLKKCGTTTTIYIKLVRTLLQLLRLELTGWRNHERHLKRL